MTRISDLPVADSIEDEDVLLLKKAGGGDRQVTVAQIIAAAVSAVGTIPTPAEESGSIVQSLTSNGYRVFAGGLVVQWGAFSNNLDTEQTVTFPMAFPNACFSVMTNRQAAGASAPICAINFTTTGFGVNRVDTIDGTETVNYIAVGY